MRIRRLIGGLGLLTAGWLGAQTGTAGACTIDGVPSLTVNGYWVETNTIAPSKSTDLRLWAPFVLAFPLHTGRVEALAEDTNLVPLPPVAFTRPWRWNFGDGTEPERGALVHHVFHRPGVYKVVVSAYFSTLKRWYTFDTAEVRVLAS